MDSSIVVVINILCNCFLKGFKGRIILLKAIEHFVFQSTKERFHDAIIIAVALSRHGLNDAMLSKFISVELVLVLPALV